LAIVAIIPARYASTRLPGKPLADIHGKPMVQHVWERARQARAVGRVLVATDDERVAQAVRGFGGEVMMTSPHHPTGTDRLAEAAGRVGAAVVVNVQGDEPLLDPRWIDVAVAPLVDDGGVGMATLSLPLRTVEEMMAPAVVKVVSDVHGDALYFSRSPIPHVRGGTLEDAARAAVARGLARRHAGLYVYRLEVLQRLAALPPSPLEQAESLEQLRALHHGIRIRVSEVDGQAPPAVDTPEDLDTVRALMAARAGEEGA
jgi:3-deoxy-manno-octulosonate cytidylyltransferase (CMP-KDO synthetase)